MSNERKLRTRLGNLRTEFAQLGIRIRHWEKEEKRWDGKNPTKWHEAHRELKSLREKRRENLRRQEEIRDVLGE